MATGVNLGMQMPNSLERRLGSGQTNNSYLQNTPQMGRGDPYSQIMGQASAFRNPYANLSGGMLGGYDPSLYRTPSAIRPNLGLGSSSGDSGGGGSYTVPSDWDSMTDAQKASYYAENPNMASVTRGLQGLFGLTSYGQLQKALDPGLVSRESLIAMGVDPAAYQAAKENFRASEIAAMNAEADAAAQAAAQNAAAMQSMQDAYEADQIAAAEAASTQSAAAQAAADQAAAQNAAAMQSMQDAYRADQASAQAAAQAAADQAAAQNAAAMQSMQDAYNADQAAAQAAAQAASNQAPAGLLADADYGAITSPVNAPDITTTDLGGLIGADYGAITSPVSAPDITTTDLGGLIGADYGGPADGGYGGSVGADYGGPADGGIGGSPADADSGAGGYGGGDSGGGDSGGSDSGGSDSGGGDSGGGDSGGDSGYAKGGKVTKGRLKGPDPKGPDEGYGALLSGEYVIKKSAVKKYGQGLLDMINDGKIPAKKMKSLLV